MRVLAFWLATACSPGLELAPSGDRGSPAVEVEPVGTFDRAPSVLRLRVRRAAAGSVLADFRFFSGSLGTYHLGRLRRRDLPQTLVDREIPAVVFVDSGDVVVAPARALDSGSFSLATPELGLLAEIVVDRDLVPTLVRRWPPPDVARGAGAQIFCGDAAPLVEPGAVELDPSGVSASVLGRLDEDGAFAELCVQVEPGAEAPAGALVVPPPLAGGAALEPLPLAIDRSASSHAPCVPPELEIGPACARVGDDRVVLAATELPSFWALERPARRLGVVAPGASLVLRGFSPEAVERLTGSAFDALGRRFSIDAEVRTGAPALHVVINEVLANPSGPEASGEWIEIVNDGIESVDLGALWLDDAVEAIRLPRYELPAGAMALLVAEGYAPEPELDLVPGPEVVVLLVPRLGRSGLANDGELLRLKQADGTVVSRWPALPSPASGVSLARRTPDAPDGEAGSFAAHAAPGASPGAPNVVN